MAFLLRQTRVAEEQLEQLRTQKALTKRWKAVSKCLRLLAVDPRHPGLHTHEYQSLSGEHGEKVFEAYAENKTPGAYRVFWHYGPGKTEITIVAITPHP
jgi:hypothetical protein